MIRLGCCLVLSLATSPANGVEPVPVPFTDVEIESRYWKSRQQTNRERTLQCRGSRHWKPLRVAGNVRRRAFAVQQDTRYPWNGVVRIRVTPETGTWPGTIQLRIPDWTRRFELAGGLYRIRNPGGWTLTLNGQAINAVVDPQGYVALERTWTAGDTIALNLEMPILRVVSHPGIVPNRGRIALQRGPLVYCIEGVDHGGSVRNLRLPADAELSSEWASDLLGGVMRIRCSRPALTAIPYGFWANRQVGEMDVWIREE